MPLDPLSPSDLSLFLHSLSIYPFKSRKAKVKFGLLFRMVIHSSLSLERLCSIKREEVSIVRDEYRLVDARFTYEQIGGHYEECLIDADCYDFLFCDLDGHSQNSRYAIEIVNKVYDFAGISARGVKPISGRHKRMM